jgi:uncharacterized protein YgiM (DUF1202 family)
LLMKLNRYLCVLLLLLVGQRGSVALAQEGPLVLAFYYAWFDQDTWSSGQSVDLPAQPYSSADRATIARQVSQAQSAGINAFIQSWYGPAEAGNQTETNFRTLLDVAGATGFKAAVDLEVTSPFLGNVAAVTNALTTLLATHAQHPAYLRYQGKPVIYFWRQQQFSVEQWAAIRSQVDPNQTSLWIAEGTDLSYQAIFDGHHLYSVAWAASPADELIKWGQRLRSYASQNGFNRLWVATVMPGYNDTRLPRANAFAVDRRNGDYFRAAWQGALTSQPNMVIINSFNEWPEGTHIEPSQGYGNLYLDITRDLVTTLRGNPPPAPAVQVETTPTTEPLPTPTGPYLKAEEGANVRSGPDTTFERVGQLAAGSTIEVIGQTENGEWWQINFPRDSENIGWVAARVVEFVGEAAAVPIVTELPTATPTAAVQAQQTVTASLTLTATAAVSSTQPSIKVLEGTVNVRSGPGLSFELLGKLPAGSEVEVIAQSETGEWWQIPYEPSENGLAWVADAVVEFSGDPAAVPQAADPAEPTPTPTPTETVIAGIVEVLDAINVRSEPSTEGEVLGGLYLGDKVEVLAVSQDGNWWLVEYPDGPEGTAWVNGEFVRFQGDQAAVAVFGQPEATATPTPRPTHAASTSTPTPTVKLIKLTDLPTLAPTATSIYQPTAAALLEQRGTPQPELTVIPTPAEPAFSWEDIPWGILALLLVAGFIWYQYNRRRQAR